MTQKCDELMKIDSLHLSLGMKTGWTEKKIHFQDIFYSYGPIIDKLKVNYAGL